MVDYTVIRSARKTMAVQIKPDGQVIVRAPLRASSVQIQRFVAEHEAWITRHLSEIEQKQQNTPPVEKLTREELEYLASEALMVIPERVRYYAPKIGVTYGRITIRNQKTRWGSCSSKGNLNFNCLLMLAPREVLDSVVVHELCHRRHMNHSRDFYNEIYRVFPDYDRCHKWLKDYGGMLLARMNG